jgi:hypothetical protein
MPYEIAELVAMLIMAFLIGTFIILFPISRRLGKAIEEWVKIRHETAPERDLLARIEGGLREMRQQLEGLDQRVGLLAERQDFTESLIESKRKAEIPADTGVRE